MNDGRPRKLGKNDPHKSKIIDLDDLKDKANTLKDKNRGKRKRIDPSLKEQPPKLGKPSQKDFYVELKIPGSIDKRIVLMVIIIILIGIVGVLAANSFKPAANETNNNTTTPTAPGNHFDNGLISFDYPEGWNVTNGTKKPVVVTVSKDENNSFVVMNEDLGKTNFTDRVFQWRQNIQQSGEITYESNITVDNTTGYNIEALYKINNVTYNAKGVAVSKDDTIYFVMFIVNGSLLDYKSDMDMVINSFHIIDDKKR